MARLTQDFLDFAKSARETRSVLQELQDRLADMGCNRLAYFTIRPPAGLSKSIYLTNYPLPWIERYDEQDYDIIDPTLKFAATTTLPFRWDEIMTGSKISKRQRSLLGEAHDFGLTRGMVVPLHGPESGLAVLGIYGDTISENDFEEIWHNDRNDISILCAYAHQAVVEAGYNDEERVLVTLSDRERECLTWTSAGKTTWEIGQILGISNETVVTHMKNAMRKLNVYSKHHAVVKAIVHGLITV